MKTNRNRMLFDANGPLEGIVRTVENTGAVSYAYAALADETLVTAQLAPQHSVEVDELLRLSIVPGRAYLFDANGKVRYS
jgi:ABC-type sugar transport system ATPase subunit